MSPIWFSNMLSKFPKFSSTLALALTLALVLTLTLSLRPVRLKIGDYYYTQGKFEQALYFYINVLRKEKLNIDHNKGDWLRYKKDLSKVKSTILLILEGHLLAAILSLGFCEDNNSKSLIKDPNLFLKKINELVTSEPKHKLDKAKEELLNFNNNITKYYKILYAEKFDNGDLDYLVATGYFLKGIIDEWESNFVLADSNYGKARVLSPIKLSFVEERRKQILLNVADECFLRPILWWDNAKNLYEKYLENGNAKNIGIFLKLGFLYAKFMDFTISYDYFKKAYKLLKDKDIKKVTDHFKNNNEFIYPDDLRLIPEKLAIQYPFLQDISFFEAKYLLGISGIKVTSRSDGFIGKTGMKSPVDIIIRSAPGSVGNYAQILINGKDVSQNKRGYNIVILNFNTGVVEESKSFDTHGSKDDVKKMMEFINRIENGKIICVAVSDEASNQLSNEEGKVFEKIGGKGNLAGKFYWGHAIIGVKGSKYGEAIEGMSEKPLEIYVISQKP